MASINKIAVLVAFAIGLSTTTAAAQGRHIERKTEKPQHYQLDTWITLDINGQTTMPAINARGLYSIQVAIPCKGTKPDWIRLRLARVLPDGRLDTTGTNTWVIGQKAPQTLWLSHLWQINAHRPVKAQIKIHGGSCSYMTTRQFKLWIP